jgi:hypothetical protein
MLLWLQNSLLGLCTILMPYFFTEFSDYLLEAFSSMIKGLWEFKTVWTNEYNCYEKQGKRA